MRAMRILNDFSLKGKNAVVTGGQESLAL